MKDRLSREAVSANLLALTALLLSLSVLPHWWNLPPVITGGFFGLLALRLLLWRDPRRIPGLWVRLPLVVLGVVVVIQQAGLTEGRQFGVALLVVMAGLKLLELKSRRDLFMAVFLGFFLLITLFLFSQSPLLTGYVLLLTIAYTGLLVLANRADAGLPLKEALGTALWLALGGVPVMVLLFALFPRLDGPLWSLNLGGASGITGMSEDLRMGSIASLSLSEETAFRVRFQGEPPPPQQRYWRGMVLWRTDGRNWTRVESPAIPLPASAPGETLGYEVTMEPSNQPWLFPLDRVVAASGGPQLSLDGELAMQQPLKRRFTYRAASRLPPLGEPLSPREREFGLQLPPRLTERTRQLVRQWRRQSASDAQLVNSALLYFNRQPFVYTLQPPLLGEDPVDQFLFETRKGFCEHYAASFVILMRLAGIPARVVIGYQGGEFNPVGGHLVVRQSDAHAWAEVWLAEQGWTRVDPTAAVAPERIEYGIDPGDAREGEPARFRLSLPEGYVASLIRSLGWYRDNLQLMWHQWVVGYNRSRQQTLLQKLGLGGMDQYRLAMVAVMGTLTVATAIFFLVNLRRRERPDPLQQTWRRFHQKLARRGLPLPASTGPLDTGRLAMRRFPDRAGEIRRIVDLYVAQRYAEQRHAGKLRELRRRVARLRL